MNKVFTNKNCSKSFEVLIGKIEQLLDFRVQKGCILAIIFTFSAVLAYDYSFLLDMQLKSVRKLEVQSFFKTLKMLSEKGVLM